MLETIFSNIGTALVVVCFFGITVFVHEFGHYIVARMCGLVVEVFSIGFGPAIWKKEVNGIVYKIGCLPFGGYVALPQLDPAGMGKIQGSDGQETEVILPAVTPGRKIAVSVAGAVGNILLALGIAFLVYWVGMPATTADQSTLVGYVRDGCEAYDAGLRIGDRILSVNGVAVDKWSHFIQESSMYDSVALEVAGRDGVTNTFTIPTEEWQYGVKMVAGLDCEASCSVAAVAAGLSAEKAGIQVGDVIVSFAGEKVFSRGHLIQLVAAHKDEPVLAVIERVVDGQTVRREMTLTPEYDAASEMTRIGIRFSPMVGNVDTDIKIHPKPLDQLRHHSMAIFRFLGSLLSPSKAGKAANMVGGPVAIVTYYVGIIKASIMLAIWFTGFLNVNLAIINLLPIPVLDGGHIMFSLWELVTRRPVNGRFVNVLVNVFAVLLICLFLFLSVRDLDRFTPAGRFVRNLFSSQTEPVEQPVEGDAAQPAADRVPGE